MALVSPQKGSDAFRTISEVADELDLPQHVLRFWETRFTSIRPLKRGGGRRYYRPDDVDLLKGIRHLLYSQGYTIKGVQRILKESGLRHVQAIGRGEEETAFPTEATSPREDQDGWDGHVDDRLEASEELAAAPVRDQPYHIEPSGGGHGFDTRHGMTTATAQATMPSRPASDDDIGSLSRALDELFECQRLLAALRAG